MRGMLGGSSVSRTYFTESLVCFCVPRTFTIEQLSLQRIAWEWRLTSVSSCAGFIRFTGHYYIILIKSRTPVALVGGHYIYHCEETVFRPIVPFTGTKAMLAEETRLMKEFERVDLSKNFYFS